MKTKSNMTVKEKKHGKINRSRKGVQNISDTPFLLGKNKTIRIPILNDEYKVIVCWGDNVYINKVFKKYHQPERDLIEFIDYRGKTFMHSHCYPIIALTSEPNKPDIIATLAHEAVHAVEYIFTYIGEQSRDELFAHSIGAIVRITLKSL